MKQERSLHPSRAAHDTRQVYHVGVRWLQLSSGVKLDKAILSAEAGLDGFFESIDERRCSSSASPERYGRRRALTDFRQAHLAGGMPRPEQDIRDTRSILSPVPDGGVVDGK